MTIASSTVLLAAATLQLLGRSSVAGHGFLTAPKVEFFTQQEDPTAYSATIDGPKALPVPDGMHYGWGPSLSTEAFTAAFSNSSYKTLREFVMKHQTMQPSAKIDPECGRTDVRVKALQPLPDQVVWEHGDNEGFTLSHEGPCEVWCDDERVFVEKNCAKMYPRIPAKLPYERAKCEGKSRLQIVWLALHDGTRWQVYMNCAPLAAGSTSKSRVVGNSSATSDSNSSSTTSAPPGTVKPSAARDDEEQSSTTASGYKTLTPSKVSMTKPRVGQASPDEGSMSDSGDDSSDSSSDCIDSDTGAPLGNAHRTLVPHGLLNPLEALTVQTHLDRSSDKTRKLKETGPFTENRDHANAPSSDSHAARVDQAPAATLPTQLEPWSSPTNLAPKMRHSSKAPKPSQSSETPTVPTLFPTRPPSGQAGLAQESASGSDDDSCSAAGASTLKKPAMIGGRPGNPYYPAIPPGGVHTRKPLLALATQDYRVSRNLEAATPAPTPTSSQQVIHWQNGAKEVIDPYIVEKAKADFEASEKKLEEWRDKLKQAFGYI